MANVSPPGDPSAANRTGIISGVVIAIGAILVASIAITGPRTDFNQALAWAMIVGPMAAGLVLMCIPRTHHFGLGLFTGVVLTLIVCGGPLTCAATFA